MKFDRVFVVSLERRPERLAAFMERARGAGLPFDVEPFQAVDGKVVHPPEWWKQGRGAWGCYRSHLRIIEDALQCGHERVLIFEDDAVFCEGFSDRVLRYLASLPAGWVQAYLGGQHLRKPVPVPGNPEVVSVRNVNRTHAYAINGREGLRRLYRHLMDTRDWRNRHHIDHHYGRLHSTSQYGFYAPAQWLVGQSDGASDISCKAVPERWWAGGMGRERKGRTFVAVLGLHRSGSSAVAMMLHKLGVSMGDSLGGYEGKHGGGGEAAGLATICEWAARFPSPAFTKPRDQLAAKLKRWITGRLKGRDIAGGKYPHLCAMGDELRSACGDDLKVIVCDRPLHESTASLKRRSAKSSGWLAVSDEQSESVQRWLWRERERFLASMPADRVLRLKWDETQADSRAAVSAIVAFLGITPTEDQAEAAAAHILEEVAA
jgi:hypothetical protein